MNTIIINNIRKSGVDIESATVTYSNGNTLFKGLYDVTYKGIAIGSVREIEGVYTFLDKHLYRPIGDIQKENLTFEQFMYVLENIRYYHFNSNLSELELNVHQKAMVNAMLKRVKRGASIEALNNLKDKLMETWKSNTHMVGFINQINTQSIFESVQLPLVKSELANVLK